MAIATDTNTLTTLISTLVDLSMDDDLAPEVQGQCLVLAKRLRGSLLNLLSARFNEGTSEVAKANAALAAVNTQVQALNTHLNAAAETIASVNALVGQLDGLLTLATTFV
jgi:hypothetical protein